MTTALGRVAGERRRQRVHPGLRLALDSEVFVMPGPMEKREVVDRQIESLRQYLAARGS